MTRAPLPAPVPHSAGTRLPRRAPPPRACDAHMHIFDPRFAPSPHWQKTPPDAPVAAYRQLQHRLGTERTVIVTPSTYGTDNACTLDALAQLGASARGVVVVGADVSTGELQRLHAAGVRGLRVNFVTPQSWGTTTPALLESLAHKAAALGWHVQVFVHPEQLVAMEGLLAALPLPVVIDHLARIDPADFARDGGSARRPREGTSDRHPREGGDPGGAAFDVLRRLLDTGHAWVKLSGVYMRSREGAPTYGDTFALGRALVRHAPTRMLWGSDWPHTTEPAGSVDDADLLDVLAAWCEGTDAWQQVLVDNPARLYGFD